MENLKNDIHYNQALKRIWELMEKNPSRNSPEGKELDMLATLVESYEMVHVPMQPSDPIAFLKYKMEKEKIKQKDLVPFIGDKTKVSKILNYKQELTISMVQKICKGLKIPANLLIPS